MSRLTATLMSALLASYSTLSTGAQPDQAQDAVPPKPVDELAQEIEDSIVSGGCGENLTRLVELIARPDFDVFLHPRRQAIFLMHAAMCTADEGKFDVALEYANRAAALDPNSFGAQGVRLSLGMLAGKPQYSVDGFEALSRLRPEHIRTIDSYRINELIDAANRSDPSGDSALKVFDSMDRAGWRPAALMSDDSMRVVHAGLLIERGRVAEARKRLEPVTDVTSLLEVRVDRRFDPLRQDPAFMAQLGWAKGIDRSIARAKGVMAGNPRQLLAVYQYAAALIAANRNGGALKILNSSLLRLLEDPAAFDDADAKSSIRNLMGALHYEMGAFDTGRALFQELVQDLDGDPFQASVQMTFARFLVGEGRAQSALDVLSTPGPMSPFGEAESESYRFCAHVMLNDKSTQESMAYIAAREGANENALSRALLCLGDLERLAELMTRRLRDPGSRRTALLLLQVSPTTAFDELPFMKVLGERVAALRARKDVLGAVQAVGRIETVPIRLPQLY